ncbi:MAG: Na+/H+ antiporter subunit E [Alphaproteobacteria bacterium]|nr:Na+/H+ antiporter subunit E [Alphaproteobacteria bacterium]|tara:strand:+ start:963 stop:1433 length:471 start_codon:yes stop_codon:yes gene_type:complete
MNLLVFNIVLALIWGVVTNSFSASNLIFGFVLAFVCLWLVRERFDQNNFYRPFRILLLIALFVYELALSGFRVARDTLSPSMKFRPAIVAFPLELESPVGIMLLANLITLTPGTLSVDVSTDRSTLYIHAMDVDDADALRADIRNGFERRIREALE